jgi:uncharacterized protein (TIGR03067 family)
MRRIIYFPVYVLVAVLLGVTGCSKAHKAVPTSIVGAWKAPGNGGNTLTLVLSGNSLEFHGDGPEWYKGTFTLREDTTPKQLIVDITDCPFPKYVGKTSHSIYQIENGTLTIAAGEPGTPDFPAGFDAPGVSKVVFTAK